MGVFRLADPLPKPRPKRAKAKGKPTPTLTLPVSDLKYIKYLELVKEIRNRDGIRGCINLRKSYLKWRNSRGAVTPEASLWRRWDRAFKAILEGTPRPDVIINKFSGCKDIYYDPLTCNEDRRLSVGGEWRSFEFDIRTTNAAKAKPRPQLNEALLDGIGHEIISPGPDREHFRVRFPTADGQDNSIDVIYCSQQSPCPARRAVWNSSYSAKSGCKLDPCMNVMDQASGRADVTRDYVGGGESRNSGYGIRVQAPQNATNPEPYIPGTPYSMLTSNTPGFEDYHDQLGDIMGRVAHAIIRHSPELYQRNENIRSMNSNLSFPSLHKQDKFGLFCWTAAQVVHRRVGAGKIPNNLSREHNIGSFHYDPGDVAEVNPLIYIPSCNGDGRGGNVADSDLVVREKQTGGKSVRIVTNVRDTVCIVLFNARLQLHGVVKGNGPDDKDAWVHRIVPFVQYNTACWMKKNPDGIPYDTYCNIMPQSESN